MQPSSSRFGNVLAAWLVLASFVLLFAGFFVIRDPKPMAGSDPLPPTHWTLRLHAATTNGDGDEPEDRYNQPAPTFQPPTSEIAELMN